LLQELLLSRVLKSSYQEIHMLDLQLMHLHVSQVFEDLGEQLHITLGVGEFMLGCEKVKDGTDVLRRPGIVAFLNLVSYD
jgi:hypothetical protein